MYRSRRATPNTKIDLQPSPDQLAELLKAGITLMAVNELGFDGDGNQTGGLFVYAIGGRPTRDYEMQALLTEVTA